MSGRKGDIGGEGPNAYELSLKASYRSRWVVSTTLMSGSRTAVKHLNGWSSVLFLCLGPSLITPALRPPDVMSPPRPSQFFITLPLWCIIVNANESENDGMWLVGDYSSSSLAK